MASLVGGILLGSVLFLGADALPPVLGHPQWRPFWVLAFAWVVFFGWSVVENRLRGCIPETELASILNRLDLGRPARPRTRRSSSCRVPSLPGQGRENLDLDTVGVPKDTAWYAHPTTFELAAVAVLCCAHDMVVVKGNPGESTTPLLCSPRRLEFHPAPYAAGGAARSTRAGIWIAIR